MARPFLGFSLALFAFAALALAFAETFAPITHSRFDVRVGPYGANAVIASIVPGSNAGRSDLRVGDIVDLSRMSFSERVRLELGISPPGTTIDLPIVRGQRHRSYTIDASARPRATAWWFVIPFLLSATVSLIVTAMIAWRRPSLATAALVFNASGALTTANLCGLISAIPDPAYGFFAVAINAVFATTPGLALLPFIVRFPRAPQGRFARMRMHAADAVFLAGFALYTFQAAVEPLLFRSWSTFDAWLPWAQAAVVLAFAALVYSDAKGDERRRIGWVIVGVVISDLGFALFNFSDLGILSGGGGESVFWIAVAELSQTALPIALAYAILRHRVIDTGFVLNRTAVYAVTTSFVLAMVGFVDWLAGRLLSEQRFAVAVEAVVTIAFGFALNWLHQRSEQFVDRLIFRRRHLAEKRIEYRIGALGFAETTAAVDDALGNDAPDILGLSSAAIFLRASISLPFTRNVARGWGPESVVEIEADALLVRSLRSLERPAFLDDLAIVPANFPQGIQRPVLAIPLVAQHDLIGIVLYGSRDDGASLDPEEVSLLARLTAAAAAAYGAVEARQWRERAAELEATLRALPVSRVSATRATDG